MPTYFVRCRCGGRHAMATTPSPCSFCGTPTFDEHHVCACCRGAEATAEQARRAARKIRKVVAR